MLNADCVHTLPHTCLLPSSSAVMRKCWRVSPEERPTFSELCSLVDRLLMSIAGYTELSMVLPQPADTELGLLLKFM